MRLINVYTHAIHEFFGDSIPEYAILSHTWGEEEVTFQDMQHLDESVKAKGGFQKIEYTCEEAQRDELGWAWVDTCCIDKTSSAELSEAINSMFHWYAKSKVCYAFLADVGDFRGIGSSRWFERGWTLQELLGPRSIKFFSQEWEYLGRKTEDRFRELLPQVSGIDPGALSLFHPDDWTIAERMSWASKRRTTRVEDIAYCLLGIFGVTIPLLYGERERAFIRLQEEIMRISDDQSLFAWADEDMLSESPCGLLARSPAQFACSKYIRRKVWSRPGLVYDDDDDETYMSHAMTNQGIRIQLSVLSIDPGDPSTFYALLGDRRHYTRPAIIVRQDPGGKFVRVHAGTLLRERDMEKRMHARWDRGITKTLLFKRPVPTLKPPNTIQKGHHALFVEYSQLFESGADLVDEETPGGAGRRGGSILLADWKGEPLPLTFRFRSSEFRLLINPDGSFVLREVEFRPRPYLLLGSTKVRKGAQKIILRAHGRKVMMVTARSFVEPSTGGGKIHCIVLHARVIKSLLECGEEELIIFLMSLMGIYAALRFLRTLILRRLRFKRLRALALISSPFFLWAYLRSRERKPEKGQISDTAEDKDR